MRHAMMMAMHGGHHMGAGFMMMGMVRRMIMKAMLVGLVIAVAVLWFRLRQQRARDGNWRL